MPREPLSNLNAIQPMVHKISCPQAFWMAIFQNIRCRSSSPDSSQKLDSITNTRRTTTSNLNGIQPTVHNISRPPDFWVFVMDFSQKLIRSSEIAREPPHQIGM